MPVRHLPLIVAALCLSAPTLPAQTLLTNVFAGTQATDFDAACTAPENNEICFGSGPLAVGANGFDVTYSANFSAAYGRLNTGFVTNGNWYTTTGVTSSGIGENYVSLAFTTSLSRIGAFMNYAPGFADLPFFRAYDAADQLVADFSLSVLTPISTPGMQDAALFRGIEYAAGIRRIELSGGFLSATDFIVIEADAPASVPEPSAVLLLLSVLPLFLVQRMKRA